MLSVGQKRSNNVWGDCMAVHVCASCGRGITEEMGGTIRYGKPLCGNCYIRSGIYLKQSFGKWLSAKQKKEHGGAVT